MKPNDDPTDWKIYVEDRNFNDLRYFVNIDKLNKLGWYEQVNFYDGLYDVIKFYTDKFNN